MTGRTHGDAHGEAPNGTGGGMTDGTPDGTALHGAPLPTGRAHLGALTGALAALEADVGRVDGWGRHLAGVLMGGGRLLAVGNGGSAALAQHLTSELVGRYRDDRAAFSALALHAEGSSFTSITNDYGADEAFARQVRAHGRPGDVLVALSTSGFSPNVLAAVEAARACGMTAWALTGRRSNPLADRCHDAVCVEAPATATVQEIHQVIVHLLCAAVDCEVGASTELPAGPSTGLRPEPRPEAPEAPAPVVRSSASIDPTSETPGGLSVVVVGDVLLDRDVEGRVERLAPDAPVPVVDEEARRSRPGGAGLAAALAAADGHRVSLVTALAGDPAGRELAALLSEAGVEVLDLGLDGATPEKVRVLAGSPPRSLLRLDRGGRRGSGDAPGAVGPLTGAAREALLSADAVLVADYGRGVTAREDLRSALAEAAPRIPVVWAPHPRGSEPVPGVRLATPNRSEAEKLLSAGNPGDGLVAVARGALSLAARWGAAGVAVTLGSGGALLMEGGVVPEDGRPFVVPALAVEGGDPCGAGDRFASRAAGLLAGGSGLAEAVSGAVAAASGFVAAGGAAAVRIRGSGTSVGCRSGGHILDDAGPEEAEGVVARVRARGGTVVATGGCFDLLHAGHVHTLRAARSLGDCLVVCLNSDASVRRLKGADRPLVPEEDRADVLRALQCVDAVILFDEETPEAVLERLRPDVFAKGGDYATDDLPEARLLARWGGRAAILPYVDGRSTTRLIEEAVSRGAR